MKFSTSLYAMGALSSVVSAYPHMDPNWEQRELNRFLKRQNLNNFPYEPNPPNCVRAPCPGLNTMANHGYINRNGRGISLQQMQNGFLQAFGMGFAATQAGGQNAIALCSKQTGKTCTTFDLDMLNQPHAIEHDGSLSRRDKEMFHDINANNHEFNQTIWDRTLDVYGATTHIGTKFANTARIVRVQEAQQADFPGWFIESVGASITEHAFTLSVMNDPALGVNLATPGANPQARMDWINFWITRQELPTPLGWHTPSQVITGNQIASLAQAVSKAPTVTINPGPSPFIPKKKRDIAEPLPSYNLELDTREFFGPKMEERDVPLTQLDNNPATQGKVQVAQARASAAAGPPPTIPNPYFTVLTPADLTSLGDEIDAYQAKYSSALSDQLGAVGIPS